MYLDREIAPREWLWAVAGAAVLHLALAVALMAGTPTSGGDAGAAQGGRERLRLTLAAAGTERGAPLPAASARSTPATAAAPTPAAAAPMTPAASAPMTPAASAPPTPAASAPPTPAAARAPLSATLSAPAREAVATAPPTGTTASAATPTAPALASASTGSAARAVDTTAAAASDVSAGPLEPAAPGLLDGGVTGARAGSGGGEARADYFDELFARVLGALDYPRRARLDGSEGVVVVRLTIDRQGRLEACAVADGSGAPVLDRHACRIARRAAPFGPVPPSFGPGDLSFELPVEFALTR